jgi:hypothetical protein
VIGRVEKQQKKGMAQFMEKSNGRFKMHAHGAATTQLGELKLMS